ncbi:heavy metal translocating P-type ATPase [Nocardioides zeae]
MEDSVALWRDRLLLLPALSGVLVVASLTADHLLGAPASLVTVLEAGGLAAGAWTFVPDALRRLARRRLGVGLLMTIAATGAVALGHIGEAAALAFLFSVAEALEERAMHRAQQGLRALLALVPDVTRVRRAGHELQVPTADLRVGDVLLLATGDRVPTDGTVLAGRSGIDTSAVTGESIPVPAEPGDDVLAGSVTTNGALEVRATADGQDNSLTQIVRLVEEAHARKGDRARLADRIARPLVPTILALSTTVALAGLLTDQPLLWLERALVVLVAASPCAMAIAVPVTVISAIGSASRLGVVIKSGQAFEQLGTIRTVALDKTGTLTRNQPRVVTVQTLADLDQPTVLRFAASLEAASTHPLATAVVTAATAPTAARTAGPLPTPTDVAEHAGHGIAGTVEGHHVRVGSARWIHATTSSTTGSAPTVAATVAALADDGMSTVVVAVDDQAVAVLGIRDELRPEAAEAVRMLHDRGVATVMLTGDNVRTAAALARAAGIDDVRAEQLPADKAAAIGTSARTSPTAMIGDGINDAPALATATVGIAMGATGSAAAVESADVAFTGHDLRLIPLALDHARRGRRIMTTNIALALAIIVVLVPLALLGTLGLAQVVLVHELAEVLVILNGLRAARAPHPTWTTTTPAIASDPEPLTLTPTPLTPRHHLTLTAAPSCSCCAPSDDPHNTRPRTVR